MRRYPVAPLLEATGLSMSALARRVGVGGGEYRRVQSEGVTELLADRWAARLGLHPAEVWPDWFDVSFATRTCEARGCDTTFEPYRSSQRYCSRLCGNRERQRVRLARLRQDPAFREAERLRRQANYEESKDYEQRRARMLWRTSPAYREMKNAARRRWRERKREAA